jgi:hypothetical protein
MTAVHRRLDCDFTSLHSASVLTVFHHSLIIAWLRPSLLFM